MFLNLIDLYGSWDSVKAAFHDYINEYPNNNKPSFTDFINKISKHEPIILKICLEVIIAIIIYLF